MAFESPVRIAQVVGRLCYGGVEMVINNYYRNIDHEKFQFDYYIHSDSECEPPRELMDMGARFYRIPPYSQLRAYTRALEEQFREHQYQIVHSNMNTLSVFALSAAKKAGVPIRINHNHSTSCPSDRKRNAAKKILKPFAEMYATDLCACSRRAGAWLFGEKAVQDGTVTIFDNAIDLARFAYNADVRREIRAELGLGDKFVVGHVGRFCYQKNHEFLIRAFRKVRDRNEKAMLVMAGTGELQGEIRAMTESMGLAGSVLFLNLRDDIERIYQAMDVFVLPSRYEGLPVAGVEAQAAGLPCLFSRDVTEEVLLTPRAEMLSLQADHGEWADAILKHDGSERSDFGDLLRSKGFDIRVEAKKMERFYTERLDRLR